MLGVALIGGLLCYLLKQIGFQGGRLLSASVSLGIALLGMMRAGELIQELLPFAKDMGLDALADGVMKVVGIGQTFAVLSDSFVELGETTIGKAVLVVGRVEILAISLPYLQQILEMSKELLLTSGG